MKISPLLPLLLFGLIQGTVFATIYTYDSLRHLTKADYGNGTVVTYTYDESGNRLTRSIDSNYRLVTVNIPDGGGTVSGAGITTLGSTVTLHATPDAGNDLDSWTEGDTVVSQSLDYSFVVADSRTLAADFGPIVLVSITAGPQSQAVASGGLANLSATATGSGQLTYRWFRNGSVISGATGPALAIPSAGLGSAGLYSVEVSNLHSTTTSEPALLTVMLGGYNDWKTAMFPAELVTENDPGIVGPDAVLAPDGSKNLLHYAFATSPLSVLPADASQPVFLTENGDNYLALRYRRLIGSGGLDYVIEAADDPNGPWSTANAQVEEVGSPVPNLDGLTEQVIVRLKTPLSQLTGKKFLRLRVTLP